MNKELLKGLSEDQLKKARACESIEELLDLAKKEGVELTEEQLNAVSGGCGGKKEKVRCQNPKCRSEEIYRSAGTTHKYSFRCARCKHTWQTDNENGELK